MKSNMSCKEIVWRASGAPICIQSFEIDLLHAHRAHVFLANHGPALDTHLVKRVFARQLYCRFCWCFPAHVREIVEILLTQATPVWSDSKLLPITHTRSLHSASRFQQYKTHAVKPFQTKYRLCHPGNRLLSLSKKKSWWKYPKKHLI